MGKHLNVDAMTLNRTLIRNCEINKRFILAHYDSCNSYLSLKVDNEVVILYVMANYSRL